MTFSLSRPACPWGSRCAPSRTAILSYLFTTRHAPPAPLAAGGDTCSDTHKAAPLATSPESGHLLAQAWPCGGLRTPPRPPRSQHSPRAPLAQLPGRLRAAPRAARSARAGAARHTRACQARMRAAAPAAAHTVHSARPPAASPDTSVSHGPAASVRTLWWWQCSAGARAGARLPSRHRRTSCARDAAASVSITITLGGLHESSTSCSPALRTRAHSADSPTLAANTAGRLHGVR